MKYIFAAFLFIFLATASIYALIVAFFFILGAITRRH